MLIRLIKRNQRCQLWAAVLSVCLLATCQSDRPKAEFVYFNAIGFTQNQIAYLASQTFELVKLSSINGKEEKQRITADRDSIFWQRELQVFLEHDINKPILRDAYHIAQGKSEGGGSFIAYQLIDSTKSGVQSMRIDYDLSDNVTSWESEYTDKNVLYANQRYVRMDLKKEDRGSYLQKYQIKGYHKLILKDSVHYQIFASLQQ